MKTPALIVGAALVFWGWQTGYWIWAAAMAAVLEGSRLAGFRWDVAPRTFYRLADGCALVFLGLTAYRFAAGTESLARWLPMAFFPLIAAQAYSTVGGVDLGAVFYTVRQKEKRGLLEKRRTVDIAYPYLALTVLAASAANVRTPAFFIALAVLSTWALWTRRPRYHPVLFAALILLAAGAGYGGGQGLHRLQVWLETGMIDWFAGRSDRRNPLRSVTAIGEIGHLKQYGHIVLRARPLGSFRAGLLLHEASFNRFTGNVWVAAQAGFQPLGQAAGDPPGTWRIGSPPPPRAPVRHIEITRRATEDDSVLSLPHGAARITELDAPRLETNGYGAVRARGPAGWVRYRVAYVDAAVMQKPPTGVDLDVPAAEAPALRALVARIAPSSTDPAHLAQTLTRHFQDAFRYSLHQDAPAGGRTPLTQFLEVSRAGHCEFFATATVLALRTAGIPARYATGYALSEYSHLEGCLIARARHAHAWALAFINGCWRPIDTTPGIWLEAETDRASALSPVMDLARWAAFRIGQWRRQWDWVPASGWVLACAVLSVAVVFRLMQKRVRRRAAINPKAIAQTTEPQRPPSPFDNVAAKLTEAGWPRRPCEPPGEWAERLARDGPDSGIAEGLRGIVRLHYRLHFHPDGLDDMARRRMDNDCLRLLQVLGCLEI